MRLVVLNDIERTVGKTRHGAIDSIRGRPQTVTRDEAIQVVLTGVTAGGLGAIIALLVNSGFKSGDVFAFSGAVVGAAGTVAGASWLADRSANRERREEQSAILEELDTLLDVSKLAASHDPREDPWSEPWQSALHAMGDVVKGVSRLLEEVINHGRTLSFHQREAINLLRGCLDRFSRFYNDVFDDESELHELDERTWPSKIWDVIHHTNAAIATFRRQGLRHPNRPISRSARGPSSPS